MVVLHLTVLQSPNETGTRRELPLRWRQALEEGKKLGLAEARLRTAKHLADLASFCTPRSRFIKELVGLSQRFP